MGLPRDGGNCPLARGSARRGRSLVGNKVARTVAVLLAVGVVCGTLSGLGGSARANELDGGDDAIAALGRYAQYLAAVDGNPFAPKNVLHSPTGTISGELAPHDFTTVAPANAVSAGDDDADRLRSYVQTLGANDQNTNQDNNQDQAGLAGDAASADSVATLRAYADGLAAEPAASDSPHAANKDAVDKKDEVKVAEADNAFDALREFLDRHNPATPPPPPPVRPAVPAVELPVIEATMVGSKVCLGCHASQADVFSHTLMGRLMKQDKMDCETCHGPGSAHVRANGCVACHGDGGISRRAGVPSLVGMDAQYLVTAMKAYITGQRKNAIMKPPLAGLREAELNRMAIYYAARPVARAQTPLVGDPAAGKAGTGLCAACHGEQGVSISPAFPSLAGQDSQYLADALKEYKDGSRPKAVACAGCHGDGGVTTKSGMPNLVGMDAQYLVAAMKAYAGGQRKNVVMKALLAGVSQSEINGMALFYAEQTPAAARTPTVGDAAAGKAASAVCAGCHGEQGVSANPAWPSLAGQDARYLVEATKAYKSGARGDEMMKGVVATLDEKTINDLAAYYAGLAPGKPGTTGVQGTPAKRDPVLVLNRLVASLDESAMRNIASYYASLAPARPAGAKGGRGAPAAIGGAVPLDGLSVGGIISFRPDDPGRSVEQNNRVCLNCHERGERAYWQGSPHEERGVACTNCHTIMKSVSAQYQLRTAFQPDTCFQCHKDRRAQMFRSAHMPMREGKVVCSDCHNPHGSPYMGSDQAMLRQDTINDNCYSCHAEKRGPFLFEHTPVRENCLNCHDPHGSMNEFSLKMPRPRLCLECHTMGHGLTSGPYSIFTQGRACQNCHTMIHGSNSPNGGALQR